MDEPAFNPNTDSLPEWSRIWAAHRLAQHTKRELSIEPAKWEYLREWLTWMPAEQPHMQCKIHKITMEQALLAAVRRHERNEARAGRMERERTMFGGNPDAVRFITDAEIPGWRWVKILSPHGLDYEGEAMGHCVGGGRYDKWTTIFSLRDTNNIPHCTLQWNGLFRSVQTVSGRGNRLPVERYQAELLHFINFLKPRSVNERFYFPGYFLSGGKLCSIKELRTGMKINGNLEIIENNEIEFLPEQLHITGNFSIRYCKNLKKLPDTIRIDGSLELLYSAVTGISENVRIGNNLIVIECQNFLNLPDVMKISGNFKMSDCSAIKSLPHTLKIGGFCYMAGLENLTRMPGYLKVGDDITFIRCGSEKFTPDSSEYPAISFRDCSGYSKWFSTRSLQKFHTGGVMEIIDCTALLTIPDRITTKKGMKFILCRNLQKLPPDESVQKNGLNRTARIKWPDYR